MLNVCLGVGASGRSPRICAFVLCSAQHHRSTFVREIALIEAEIIPYSYLFYSSEWDLNLSSTFLRYILMYVY